MTASDLMTQQENMNDYYNKIKNISYDKLTSEEKDIINTYNNISNAIALIYTQLKPDTWNSMNDVLYTDDIEVTKDDLLEMAKAGTLDEDTIKSYKNLNSTLEDTDIFLEDHNFHSLASFHNFP
jgi:hypothetical protein